MYDQVSTILRIVTTHSHSMFDHFQ